MRIFLLFLLIGNVFFVRAQTVSQLLSKAMAQLEKEEQFKHATLSLYVADTKTGNAVFEKNIQAGMAPASCQKVITSVTAFELLGKDFVYKTYIGKDFPADNKYDAGCLFVIGAGDPTLGSWRWKNTMDTLVFSKILTALKKQKLSSFDANMVVQDYAYGLTPLPDGWIWEDMGNYYGAACFGFNWNENQFQLVLQPGTTEGSPAAMITENPFLYDVTLTNNIKTGKAGSGDEGYIYSSPYSNVMFAKGTVPLQKKPFTISGSIPNPSNVFKTGLMNYLANNAISFKGSAYSANEALINNQPLHVATHIIDSIVSPSFDSMNYWFLKKSINLYGEAFLKSIWVKKNGFATRENMYEQAIETVQNFWKDKGIEPSAINIMDGSGLSPANRVTTYALVTVMQYAKKQNWFPSFYNALPEMNGIKMKDGYIGGVRSYTGYIKSRSGVEYTFSFMVNNFSGSPATAREKMYKILDLLK